VETGVPGVKPPRTMYRMARRYLVLHNRLMSWLEELGHRSHWIELALMVVDVDMCGCWSGRRWRRRRSIAPIWKLLQLLLIERTAVLLQRGLASLILDESIEPSLCPRCVALKIFAARFFCLLPNPKPGPKQELTGWFKSSMVNWTLTLLLLFPDIFSEHCESWKNRIGIGLPRKSSARCRRRCLRLFCTQVFFDYVPSSATSLLPRWPPPPSPIERREEPQTPNPNFLSHAKLECYDDNEIEPIWKPFEPLDRPLLSPFTPDWQAQH